MNFGLFVCIHRHICILYYIILYYIILYYIGVIDIDDYIFLRPCVLITLWKTSTYKTDTVYGRTDIKFNVLALSITLI